MEQAKNRTLGKKSKNQTLGTSKNQTMERKDQKFGTSMNQEMEQAKCQAEQNTWKQQEEQA
jgi:hypothetical protein